MDATLALLDSIEAFDISVTSGYGTVKSCAIILQLIPARAKLCLSLCPSPPFSNGRMLSGVDDIKNSMIAGALVGAISEIPVFIRSKIITRADVQLAEQVSSEFNSVLILRLGV